MQCNAICNQAMKREASACVECFPLMCSPCFKGSARREGVGGMQTVGGGCFLLWNPFKYLTPPSPHTPLPASPPPPL